MSYISYEHQCASTYVVLVWQPEAARQPVCWAALLATCIWVDLYMWFRYAIVVALLCCVLLGARRAWIPTVSLVLRDFVPRGD